MAASSIAVASGTSTELQVRPSHTNNALVPEDPAEYEALEKAVVRKIDFRLMPVLIIMIILK